jgi:glycolate dehydrogenase iron-sulfur subunit
MSEFAAPAGLDACTRCGLCLQACPTYRDLKLEADSPRGRVFLIKQAVEEADAIDATMAGHLYACLGCRACETVCPSGVPFGKLLEFGRAQVEYAGELGASRRGWRLFRRIAFEWVLPRRGAFALLMAPARWLQRMPSFVRALLGLPMPARVRKILRMLPPEGDGASGEIPEFAPAEGPRRARVGLFVGCVMGALFGGVNEALHRVLRRNGCDVVTPSRQWCCGALNLHAGERRHARAMARRTIDVFENANVEAVVVDSAGCGAEMKSYGELLADDPAYASRAVAFAAKVKDASEFLVGLGLCADVGHLDCRVTYQDACHLAHGQHIRKEPRALLNAIPGVELVEMTGSDRCCGAAGVYALTHPDMSGRILAEKMATIDATGAEMVVVSNPGCHMQLLAAVAEHRPGLRVRHIVQVLDDAYRQPVSAPARL